MEMEQKQKSAVLKELGQRVRQARAEKGLTQAMVAAKLGMSVAYLSLIERGGRNPPYTTVVEIARVMGYSPRQLLQG
jgi:transcriptional regulator with XRE-family HTH domain